MKNKIGIGILDIYNQELLDQCYSSIPEELKENVFITSVGNNNLPKNVIQKKYTTDISLAAMKNWIISQMRIKDLKYYFILDSNVLIKDPTIFEKVIKIAQTFGTWMMVGPSPLPLPIEDDEANVTLNVSLGLNTSFLFIYSGIIKNNGYFDERYFNTKNLDVLDYIIKLRTKGVYPPNNYNPIVQEGLEIVPSQILKKNHIDAFDMITRDMPKDVQLSYGYFYHKHKYLPGQNDPAPVDKEKLVEFIEQLQKNYARPEL
jgi:hypothetical protein